MCSVGLKHPILYLMNVPPPRRGWRLDRGALKAHIDAYDDMTYAERARHFGVSESCIWYGLRQLKISRKKNDEACRTQPYEKASVSEDS